MIREKGPELEFECPAIGLIVNIDKMLLKCTFLNRFNLIIKFKYLYNMYNMYISLNVFFITPCSSLYFDITLTPNSVIVL